MLQCNGRRGASVLKWASGQAEAREKVSARQLCGAASSSHLLVYARDHYIVQYHARNRIANTWAHKILHYSTWHMPSNR